jgi:HEAT repeat protein
MLITRAASALQIRTGEGRLVTLLVALTFLPSTGGAIGSPSVEALFYARFGVKYLPVMYVALGLVTLLTSLLLTALLGRFSRRRLYLALLVVLGGGLVLARMLVGLHLNWFYPVLWLSMYLLWTLQGLIAWGLAGSVCTTRQAKRLFPLFGAGGILGIAVGGLLTRWLVALLGTENLLLVWAGTLLASFLIVRDLTRGLRDRRPRAGRRRARLSDDLQRGFQFVRRSPLMRWIAAAALLFSVLLFTMAFPFSQAVARHFAAEDSLTGFLGVFQGLTTAVAFVIALLAANRLYAWLGFMGTLLALPLIYLAGFSLLLTANGFAVLVAFRFIQMAWLQGVSTTAYQAIFNVVPPDWREQTRTFIDGVPTQAGTILVGAILLLGGQSLQPWHLFAGGAFVAALAAWVTWRARQAYGQALAEALKAGQPQVFLSEARPFGVFQRDAAALTAVLAGLESPDPAVRRVSAEILGSVGVPAAVGATVNALDDHDVQVRVAALRSLAAAKAVSAVLDVTALLSDPEPEVRLQAVETLRQLAGFGRGLAHHLQPLLDDSDPAVRSRSAVALLRAGPDPRAAQTLLSLAQSNTAGTRALALEGLAEWGDAAAHTLAAAALTDSSPLVRRAAVFAAARIDRERSIEPLIQVLGDPDAAVRRCTAEVLAGLGLPILGRIVQALADPLLEAGALETLERIPPRPAEQALAAYARNKVAVGRKYDSWRRGLAPLEASDDHIRLLCDSLAEAARRQALWAIRAVGLLDEPGASRMALQGLQSGDPGQQANALEMIDNWDGRDIVRPILALWDAAPELGASPSDPAAWLRPILDDADPWLRACASFASGKYSDPSLQGKLGLLAEADPDLLVRATASAALGQRIQSALPVSVAGAGEALMETLSTLSVMDRILFLQRVPLFSDLPPAELKQVAAIATELFYLDRDIIAHQGDPGDEMYIIVSGEVLVMAEHGGPSATELARRGPGEYVGEMAIISQEPRMASLVAHGDVRVLNIEQAQFEAILRERPDTSLAVMRVLCARLKEMQNLGVAQSA